MARSTHINRRRLIGTLALVAVMTSLATAAFAYRRYQISRKFAQYRIDGMAADARHDTFNAVNLLGQFLARYPDDVPALTRYASDRLLIPLPGDAQVALAISSLRYALQLDPTLKTQRRTLMSLYVQNGYWTEALESANAVLNNESAESAKGDREPLKARAMALTRLHRTNEAIAAADAWCTADAASVEARILRLDLAHIVDEPFIQNDAKIRDWSAKGNLTTTAIDLLKGHAHVLDGDPTGAKAPLSAAAKDQPFDSVSAGPLVRDLDYVGLWATALEVARARHAADPANLDLRIDLVRREWIAQQFHAVIDLVSGVENRAELPCETLGLDAVAKSELGRSTELGKIADELSARNDLSSRAWSAVVSQLSSGKFEPEKLLAACGPVLRNVEGPVLRYYVGESYYALGDRQQAAHEWQRVLAAEPAWALPAIHLCQLLTENGQPKLAMAAGFAAIRRAPHDSQAATALAFAWASAVDTGQDSDIDGCLALIDQLVKQLPDDTKLPATRAMVLARAGRDIESASVIRQALEETRVLPEQVWFDFAAISEVAQLGLEKHCLARDRKEHGLTPRLAYAQAISVHFAAAATTYPTKIDTGLETFDADFSAAAPSPSSQLQWRLARNKYLDVTANPIAVTSWAKLSDDFSTLPLVQQLATLSPAVQTNARVMAQAVQRLGLTAGADSPLYQLAQVRFNLLFGTTLTQVAESRQLLDAILHKTPDSMEAKILSAQAFEKSGQMFSAINELRAALAIDSESAAARLDLARLLQTTGDFSGALEQFDHVDVARLTTDDQRQQAATLLAQHGQAERAIGLLQGPIEAQSPNGRLMLARLYQKTGKNEQALAVITQLLKKRPSPAAIAFGADLLGSMGQVDDGRIMLEQLSALPSGEVSPGISDLIRAEYLLKYQSSGDTEPAFALLASAAKSDPTNPTIWHARISAALALDRINEAISVATDGAQSIQNDPVLNFFHDSASLIQNTAADPAVRLILNDAVSNPNSVQAVAEAIKVIQKANLEDQSIDWLVNRLADLIRKYPDVPAIQLYLVSVYENAGRMQDAVTIASRVGESFADNPEVLRAETNVLVKASRWPEVIQTARKWKKQNFADGLDADLATAEALIKSGRSLEVAQVLSPYTDQPTRPGYLRAMTVLGHARVMAGSSGSEAGMEPLMNAGAAGRAAWMLFAVQSLPPDQAAFDIKQAVARMPSSDADEHVTASEMLMRLADRTGDKTFAADATEILKPFIAQPHPTIPVLLAGASWAEKNGDAEAALALYKRALLANPELPEALNNVAMILARTGRPDQSLPLMDRAIQISPLLADLYDTRAFAFWKTGQLDAAILDVNHALRLDPRRLQFRLRRLQLFVAAGRIDDAESALRRIESDFAETELQKPEIQAQLVAARFAIRR